jgi:DNA polymerase-3 subunit delta'
MRFNWNIIGHEQQLRKMESEIQTGNLAHANLLAGPYDVGKFRIARAFAGILLCDNGHCGSCRICQNVWEGCHPDLIEIRDNGESIKIDYVRELIGKTNLTSQGAKRIVLIENVERMPVEAQNSFLKTLEEPTKDTFFIMTTSRVGHLLSTIISRVRRYDFFPVDSNYLLQALSERFPGHVDLDEIVQVAQGRPGLAIQLLNSPGLLNDYKKLYSQIDYFIRNNDVVAKFVYVDSIYAETSQIQLFFDTFFRYLRKVIHDYNSDSNVSLAHRFSLAQIVHLFEYLVKTRYLVERNANKKLALENFMLQTEVPGLKPV